MEINLLYENVNTLDDQIILFPETINGQGPQMKLQFSFPRPVNSIFRFKDLILKSKNNDAQDFNLKVISPLKLKMVL